MEGVVYFACSVAGVSGDMIAAALADLCPHPEEVLDRLRKASHTLSPLGSFKASISEARRRGVRGKRFEVVRSGGRGHVSATLFAEVVEKAASEVGLSSDAYSFVEKFVAQLVEAEARVHGVEPSDVELHELGSVDTAVDVLAVALFTDELGLWRCEAFCSEIAVGSGFVDTSHGKLPIPPPITSEVAKKAGYALVGSPAKAELATPTGVLALYALGAKYVPLMPSMKLSRVGCGCGSREFEEFPNVLWVLVGEKPPASVGFSEVVELETTVDDVPGEVVGGLFEELFERGALDVVVIPALGKKNRPAYVVKALAKPENYSDVALGLMQHLGTLGVRVQPLQRYVAERMQAKVSIRAFGQSFLVRVKAVLGSDGRVLRVKPEYEDVKAISKAVGKPFAEVWRVVEQEARRVLEKR